MKNNLCWICVAISLAVTTACDHHPKQNLRHLNETLPKSHLASETGSSQSWSRSLTAKLQFQRCGSLSPSQEAAQATQQLVKAWEQRNQHRDLATETYPIKVWWHVMKAGNTRKLGAWGRGLAQQSIDRVNYHFRDTPFVFTLAGMTQTTKLKWFQCPDDNYKTEYQYKTTLRVEGADTLNVYMCDLLNSQGNYGSATFPDDLYYYPEYDGIKLGNPFSGGAQYGALDAYITLVHEIGHWLGLYHTFEGLSCRGQGDVVTDTPAHPQPSWELDGSETCFEGYNYNSCPDNVPGIDPGLDPVFNHMNYIDSLCEDESGEFTNGQVQRMMALFEEYRYQQPTCRYRNVRCMKHSHCCSGNCRQNKCV